MTTPSGEHVVLTVRGRQFFAILRELREKTDMTQEQAGAAVGMSRQQYQRFETGLAKRIKTADVEAVLDLFGCPRDIKLGMLDLAPQLQKRGLWTTYDDVIDNGFAEVEAHATDIRSYQTLLIPGLLQTPEYTLALMRSNGAEGEILHRLVAARAARRRRLNSLEGPTFHAVIWEPALHKRIGGVEVWREQLRALVQAATRPNLMLQVLPMDSWEHPGNEGSFVVFGFGGPSALDVAYFEGAAGSSLYLEKPNEVELCSVNFDRISKAALPQIESVELIEALLV